MEIENEFDPVKAAEVAAGAFLALVAFGTLKAVLKTLLN